LARSNRGVLFGICREGHAVQPVVAYVIISEVADLSNSHQQKASRHVGIERGEVKALVQIAAVIYIGVVAVANFSDRVDEVADVCRAYRRASHAKAVARGAVQRVNVVAAWKTIVCGIEAHRAGREGREVRREIRAGEIPSAETGRLEATWLAQARLRGRRELGLRGGGHTGGGGSDDDGSEDGAHGCIIGRVSVGIII